MRKAIVTLAIGPGYQKAWSTVVHPNWRRYAARHGYDLVCFDKPLDMSERARNRPPAWQKLLILGRPEVSAHDVVVWVDLDIIMNDRAAPCIASSRSSTKVGICEQGFLPGLPIFELLSQRIVEQTAEYRRNRGFTSKKPGYVERGLPDPGLKLNTGVMVLGRQEHRQLLEHVYASYEKPAPGMGYEQAPLSYELIKNDAYEILDPKFNVLLLRFGQAFTQASQVRNPIVSGRVALICALFSSCYFLHFAGALSWMGDLRYIDFDRDPVALRTDRMAAALRQQFAPAAGANRPSAAEG